MTTTEDIDEEFVGRCYTKARRAPLVHGVIRSVNGGPNLRLPGGPYTLTQLAAIVISVGLLILTRPVWGGHGVGDVVVLIGVPFGAAFGMRHLHIDGRNPAAAATSVVMMLGAPRWGRIHGRPFRPARPAHVAPRVTLAQSELADHTGPVDRDQVPKSTPRTAQPPPDPAPRRPAAAPVPAPMSTSRAARATNSWATPSWTSSKQWN
ncbi:hypothetical protein ABT187_45655 [Streptomyces sp. NPDC001817]|uniref:hypothetical protein n=1 Tax=Streptomyces sp. NPDC001817 TaxID=3154398 RepID=UPI00332B2504